MWRWGVLIVLAATAARADNKRDAAQLFEQGRALAVKAQYAEACVRFAASNRLDHAAGTEMNLGDCEEHLGHLAEAWRWFTDAAAQFGDAHDSRVDYAQKRADLLEPRLALVVVHLHDPEGATVTVGRRELKAHKKIKERVDPGDVAIKVELPAPAPAFEHTFTVAAGETKAVWPDGSPDGADDAEPEPGPETAPHRGAWRIAFAGAAAVAVAGAGIFYYGHERISDAQDQLCHGGAYLSMAGCQYPVTLTQAKVAQLNDQGSTGRTIAIAGELTTVIGVGFAAVAAYEGFFASSSVTVAPTPGGASAAISFAW
jgi:hypothetical protein